MPTRRAVHLARRAGSGARQAPLSFDDLGEQTVKNIARPIRVFGLTPAAIATAPELSPPGTGLHRLTGGRGWLLALSCF